MKTLTLVLAILGGVATLAQATVITVSNHPLSGAEYNNLWDAYNNASAGDTLMLEGTDIAYGLLNCGGATYYRWDKPLTVIGIGFNPDKHDPKRTIIGRPADGCITSFRIGAGANGSKFYGIVFIDLVQFDQNTNSILFESCEFVSSLYLKCTQTTNLVVRNSVLNVNFSNGTGCNVVVTASIENSILNGQVRGENNTLSDLTIDHCLFLSAGDPFVQQQYAQVKNSIFTQTIPVSVSNSEFLNNIAMVAGVFPTADGNTSSGNLTSTDPLFMSYSGGSYSPDDDFDTQAGSPVEGAASDGTDIGVHGGTSHFSETGEVLIAPIIRSVDILNTSVAPGGTLNVDLHATKPADN